VAIFQHSLPFLQSESFQTHVGSIHRRAIGPLAHHNGTSAYSPSLTCTSPDDRMSSSSTVLTRVLLSQLHEKFVDNSLVSMELNYSLVTLLSAWLHCWVTSIISLLRYRGILIAMWHYVDELLLLRVKWNIWDTVGWCYCVSQRSVFISLVLWSRDSCNLHRSWCYWYSRMLFS
jgi:hypothetical protein